MTIERINTLKETNTEKLEGAIVNALLAAGVAIENVFERSIDIAYLLYLSVENQITDNNDFTSLSALITDEDLKANIIVYDKAIWDKFISKFKMKYSADEYLAYVLFAKSKGTKSTLETSTPKSIVDLTNSLLSINDGDTIADICSGFGDYLVSASGQAENASLYGIELNEKALNVARVRLNIIEAEYAIDQSDAFFTIGNGNKYDKIFSNFPFALRDRNQQLYAEQLLDEMEIDYDKVKIISTDWVFALLAASKLKDDGKAVVIIPNGTASSSIEKQIRELIINAGLIETVIELPQRLFIGTNVATTMLVLSKNNDKINFVDAKNIFTAERRNNVLTNENISTIVSAIGTKSDISDVVSVEEVIKAGSVLIASKYINSVVVENGVPFEQLIKKITRGAQLKANELDALTSKEKTDYQYLTIANVKNGLIDLNTDPQYITSISDNLLKYCVSNNSLIVSKIASPDLKVAVAEVEEGATILANGNLYVIELDETKVEPYYLQAFFDSKFGKAVVAPKLNGNTFQMITVGGINELLIPLPDMETQKQIAKKYRETLNKIVTLQSELKAATDELETIFEM